MSAMSRSCPRHGLRVVGTSAGRWRRRAVCGYRNVNVRGASSREESNAHRLARNELVGKKGDRSTARGRFGEDVFCVRVHELWQRTVRKT